MKRRTLIGALGLAVAAAPLAASTAGVADAASTKTVTLENINYLPSKVTIKKGGKVKWVWRDGSIRHDVGWTNHAFKTSKLQSKGTYTVTFKKKGTYHFFCSVHSTMKGTVKVT